MQRREDIYNNWKNRREETLHAEAEATEKCLGLGISTEGDNLKAGNLVCIHDSWRIGTGVRKRGVGARRAEISV
jgi:hypothetical protein